MNNFERGINPKKAMNIGVEARLNEQNIEFTRTALGEPVFIKKGAKDASNSIRPRDWSFEELRTIVNYMEAYPDCKEIK